MLLLPYRTENAPQRRPWVTWTLVAANAAVFLYTAFLDPVKRDMLFMDRGFVPDEWRRWGNFLTCLFLHSGWLHVIGNMFFLLLFGRLVEDRLGRVGFTLLYFSSGVLASLTHLLTTPEFLWDVPCVGASGAVSGILGAAAVICAGETVSVFYLWILTAHPLYGKIDTPAIVFLAFWFLGQFLYAISFSEMSAAVEVAYWAHVGGFAFGVVVGLIGGVGSTVRELSQTWRREHRKRAVLKALRRGDWAGAAKALGHLKERDGLPPDWDLLSARLALEQGDADTVRKEGSAIFREALARHDHKRLLGAYALLSSVGDTPALSASESLVLARALKASSRRAEALAWLTHAIKREREGSAGGGLVFELAEMELEAGQPSRATDLFEFVARTWPGSKLAQSAQWRLREIPPQGPCPNDKIT